MTFSHSEFQRLLESSISSCKRLRQWLEDNKQDNFDLEEAYLLVNGYLKEARSFQADDQKRQEKRLYDLVCKTMNSSE